MNIQQKAEAYMRDVTDALFGRTSEPLASIDARHGVKRGWLHIDGQAFDLSALCNGVPADLAWTCD